MKKIITIVYLVLNLFFVDTCALTYTKIKIGDCTGTGHKYGYRCYDSFGGSLFVYKDVSDHYIITVSSPKNKRYVSGIAVFSSDGVLLESEGIKVIRINEIIEFFNKYSLKDFNKKFKNIHCDIGSGMYVPSFIVENATVLFLQGSGFKKGGNGIVTGIGYWDIIGKRDLQIKF